MNVEFCLLNDEKRVTVVPFMFENVLCIPFVVQFVQFVVFCFFEMRRKLLSVGVSAEIVYKHPA